MNLKPPVPTPPPRPPVDPAEVRPRNAAPDDFEQNPLNQVSERLSMQAATGLDDAGRVREAMRIVISEGVPVSEAARRCHVAPSHLAQWRAKYLELLNEAPSIASSPLIDPGMGPADADLVRIPRAAREQFAENWARLMERTRATPASFHQHPVIVFLENSWLTSWLYQEGKLDRGVASGAAVVVLVLILTGSFLTAGRFYQHDDTGREKAENFDLAIRRAADVARNFFNAATMEEKMKFARADGPVKVLMEDFYRRHPATALPGAILRTAAPEKDFYILEFDLPSLQRNHRCVVVQRDGQMLVDWESCSLFQEVNLEEIRRNHPQQPARIAVQVRKESYYNFGFNQDQFTCYRLSYPGIDFDLFGYARRDTPEANTLTALLRPLGNAERQISAVLEVRYPAANAKDNQVEIVRIISEEWGTSNN